MFTPTLRRAGPRAKGAAEGSPSIETTPGISCIHRKYASSSNLDPNLRGSVNVQKNRSFCSTAILTRLWSSALQTGQEPYSRIGSILAKTSTIPPPNPNSSTIPPPDPRPPHHRNSARYPRAAGQHDAPPASSDSILDILPLDHFQIAQRGLDKQKSKCRERNSNSYRPPRVAKTDPK